MIPSVIVPITYREILSGVKTALFSDENNVLKFEQKFSEYIGCNYAIATSSGTSSLYLLLKAYGIKKGDEIVMPAYTCEGVARLIIDMGCDINFVDVEKETYNISVDDLCNRVSGRTKVILAIHMFGNPCNMESIMEVAGDYNVAVIEDSAQTVGAEHHGKKTGTIGDSGFFSFGTAKPLTTMNGGMIVSEDVEIVKKVRKIAESFRSSNHQRLKILTRLTAYSFIKNPLLYAPIYKFILNRRITRRCALEKESMNLDDLEYAYTDVQAAVGMVQLLEIDRMNRDRIANANYLMKSLNDMETIHSPKILNNVKPIFLRLPIQIEGASVKMRDELIQRMQKAGIDTPVAYPNVLPKFFGLSMEKYPNTEELVEKTITLPTHPCVRSGDLKKIVEIIRGAE